MTHTDIVRKLIGPINPIGKSEVDAERLENLKEFTNLVDALLQDLDQLVYDNRHAHEGSIKASRSFATQFLTEMVTNFKDGYNPTTPQ